MTITDIPLPPFDLATRLSRRLVQAGECLEYCGSRSDGDGTIRVNGRMSKAHRVAWELEHGQIPDGLCILHRCDNRPCCNVDHLFIGTVDDNNKDRAAKGRTRGLIPGANGLIKRTHCPHGHPYSGSNLRIRPDGRRRCAECYRLRSAKRRNNLNA